MELISFAAEQTKEILDLIGVDTSRECVGKCQTCKRDLFLNNIGNIARSGKANLLYCDNPNCFAEKIAEKYIKEHDAVHAKGEQNG